MLLGQSLIVNPLLNIEASPALTERLAEIFLSTYARSPPKYGQVQESPGGPLAHALETKRLMSHPFATRLRPSKQ